MNYFDAQGKRQRLLINITLNNFQDKKTVFIETVTPQTKSSRILRT